MKQVSFKIYLFAFFAYCMLAGSLLFHLHQSSSDLNDSIERIVSDFHVKRHAISEMSESTKNRLLMVVQMLGNDDPIETNDIYSSFLEQGTRFLKARDLIENLPLSDAEELEIIKISDTASLIAPQLRLIAADLLVKNDIDEITERVFSLIPSQQHVTDSYNALIESITDQASAQQTKLHDNIVHNQRLILALSISFGIVGIIILILAYQNQHTLNQARQQAEQQRRQADLQRQRAENANHEKSLFLANMSHELRTPMHAILSFASLALKKAEDEKQVRFLENIRTSGIRLTTLLNDLLDLSKLEAGKMQAEYAEQDIKILIEQALNEVSSLLMKKNISVDLSAPDQHYQCMIDQKLMCQVFVNLLSNAIKFSPDNSQLEVNLQQLHKDFNQVKQAVLRIEFIDAGIGIPADELDSIFEKFVQSSKTKTNAGGTGLGLPITKEIIELHKGKIWAESPPRGRLQGAAFFIEMPALQVLDNQVSIANIQDAIDSHLEWRKFLDEKILHQQKCTDMNTPILSNENLCSLGQWINAGQLQCADLEALKAAHREFHFLAGECIAYCEMNQFSRAREKNLEFHQASDRVIELLNSAKSA